MMMQNILQTTVLTQVYIWLLGILSKTKPRVRNKQMRAFQRKRFGAKKLK